MSTRYQQINFIIFEILYIENLCLRCYVLFTMVYVIYTYLYIYIYLIKVKI